MSVDEGLNFEGLLDQSFKGQLRGSSIDDDHDAEGHQEGGWAMGAPLFIKGYPGGRARKANGVRGCS